MNRASITDNVYVLGICGSSASGKSYAVKKIVESLLPIPVSVIDQDSYYKDFSHLSLEERDLLNFDHPDAIDFTEMCESIKSLKEGIAISKPIYDFVTHSRLPHCHELSATKIVIVEGLHVLHIESIRELVDQRVFIEVDRDIRFIRRLKRDMAERGRTVDGVIKQYLETVRPMDQAHVQPSRQYADITIRHDNFNEQIDSIIMNLRKICG